MRNGNSCMRAEFSEKAATGEIQLELNDHRTAAPEIN